MQINLTYHFLLNFDFIKAFNTLTRAAKYIESKKPEAAVQFYKKAADLYKMEGGRIREAADVLGRAACLQVRQEQYPNAIATIERERDLRVEAQAYEAAARTNCCLVLVYLKKGDFDGAKNVHSNAFKIISGYDNTDASAVIEEFLSTIMNGSIEDFAAQTKNPYFRGLENDFVKLLRNMEMPEGVVSSIDFNEDPAAKNEPDFNSLSLEPSGGQSDEPDFT